MFPLKQNEEERPTIHCKRSSPSWSGPSRPDPLWEGGGGILWCFGQGGHGGPIPCCHGHGRPGLYCMMPWDRDPMNRHVTENVTFPQSSNVGGGNYKREVSRKIVGRCGGLLSH